MFRTGVMTSHPESGLPTSPSASGSAKTAKTIGVVSIACLAARTPIRGIFPDGGAAASGATKIPEHAIVAYDDVEHPPASTSRGNRRIPPSNRVTRSARASGRRRARRGLPARTLMRRGVKGPADGGDDGDELSPVGLEL